MASPAGGNTNIDLTDLLSYLSTGSVPTIGDLPSPSTAGNLMFVVSESAFFMYNAELAQWENISGNLNLALLELLRKDDNLFSLADKNISKTNLEIVPVKVTDSLLGSETKAVQLFNHLDTAYIKRVTIVASNGSIEHEIDCAIVHELAQANGVVVDIVGYLDDIIPNALIDVNSVTSLSAGQVSLDITNLTLDNLTLSIFIN